MNRTLVCHIKSSARLPLHSQRTSQRRNAVQSNLAISTKSSFHAHLHQQPSLRQLHTSPVPCSPDLPTPKGTKTPQSESSSPHQNRKTGPEDVPPIEAAPFSELGATKTVKIVVYIAISIVATLETITYGTWIWNKWFKKEQVGEEAADRKVEEKE